MALTTALGTRNSSITSWEIFPAAQTKSNVFIREHFFALPCRDADGLTTKLWCWNQEEACYVGKNLTKQNIDLYATQLKITPAILDRIIERTTYLDEIIEIAKHVGQLAKSLFNLDVPSDQVFNMTFEIEKRRKEITTLLKNRSIYVTKLNNQPLIAHKNPQTGHTDFYLVLNEILGTGGFRSTHPLLDYQKKSYSDLVVSIEDFEKKSSEKKLTTKRRFENLEKLSRKCMVEGKFIDTMKGNANIISSLFYGIFDYKFYLITERCAGTLKKLLKKRHSFSDLIWLDIYKQIVKGVEALHAKNIVHRDLKPDNILFQEKIDGGYGIKIIDFNISCLFSDNQELTQSCGTRAYLAPEAFLKTLKEYPDRLDSWSLGIILYILCEGKQPEYAYKIPSSSPRKSPKIEGSPRVQPLQKADASLSPQEIFQLVTDGAKKLRFTNTDEKLQVLIKDLLNIEPRARPTAAELLKRLESIERISTHVNQQDAPIDEQDENSHIQFFEVEEDKPFLLKAAKGEIPISVQEGTSVTNPGLTYVNASFQGSHKYFAIKNSDLAAALKADLALVNRVTRDVKDLHQIVAVIQKLGGLEHALHKKNLDAYKLILEVEKKRSSIYNQLKESNLKILVDSDNPALLARLDDQDQVSFFVKLDTFKKDKDWRSTSYLLDYQQETIEAFNFQNLEKIEQVRLCEQELDIYEKLKDVPGLLLPYFSLFENVEFNPEGKITKIGEKATFGIALPNTYMGKSFNSFVKAQNGRSAQEIINKKLAAFEQIFSACLAVNSKKIVHRNLKSKTIRIVERTCSKFEVKITGFHPACSFDSTDSLRKVKGVLHYNPPEIFRFENILPEKIDSWALGMLLYEIFEGKKAPYINCDIVPEGSTLKQVIANSSWDKERTSQLITERLKSVAFSPENPAAALIKALLEQDPRKRLSISDAYKQLQALRNI